MSNQRHMQHCVSASVKKAHNALRFTKNFGYAPQIAERTEESGNKQGTIIRSNYSVPTYM